MEKLIKMTEAILNKGRSRTGAWSRRQIRLLGESPDSKSWKKKILGKKFPVETIDQFIELRDQHLDDPGRSKPLKVIKKNPVPELSGIDDIRLFVEQEIARKRSASVVYLIITLKREITALKEKLDRRETT